MVRVFVLLGSPRFGNTYRLCTLFLEELRRYLDVEYVVRRVQDYRIEYCRGCLTCILKGEECPIQDDFERLRQDIEVCDLFVLASPVYVMDVTAQLKTVMDRACSWYHRPPFLGKYAVVVATTASVGLRQVLRILRSTVVTWGMVCLGEVGAVVRDGEILQEEKVRRQVQETARYVAEVLQGRRVPEPSLLDLILFHVFRHRAVTARYWAPHEYEYWRQHNLFQKPYYTDRVRVPPWKRVAAKLLTAMSKLAVR